MSGDVLLDTNIIIALMEKEPAAQQGLLSVQRYFVPSVVLGELYFGALRSARREENLARVDRFAATHDVLVFDAESARNYGAIRDDLRRKGRPIPDNDIWVAAIARQHNLTLITRDTHFQEVEGLSIGGW